MKRNLYISIITILIIANLNSQPTKGAYVLGGTIGFTKSSQNTLNFGINSDGDLTVTELKIGPQFGYFVSEHFVLGLSGGYFSVEEKDIYLDHSKSSSVNIIDLIVINPFLRYNYFINEYWGYFSDLSISYGWGTDKMELYHGTDILLYDILNSNISNLTFSLNPGVIICLSNKILLEASVGVLYFSQTTIEIGHSTIVKVPQKEYTDYGVALNFNKINVGVLINL